tara:strand:+ start:241 stop:468 length:228 start_codon:yes stop_codon:yes gene_type:complete
MSSIKQFTCDILDKFINEIKKEENMDKIKENVLSPMVEYIFKRLYPYIVVTSIIFILTFVLAVAIFYMVFKTNAE